MCVCVWQVIGSVPLPRSPSHEQWVELQVRFPAASSLPAPPLPEAAAAGVSSGSQGATGSSTLPPPLTDATWAFISRIDADGFRWRVASILSEVQSA